MFKKLFKNEKGLTLVELLAVIVILGIVAGIAVPSVMNIMQKSKVNAVKADAIQILSAAKTYAASNPDDAEISESEIADYISKSKLNTSTSTTVEDFTVAVLDEGETFKLTTKDKVTVNNATLTFTGATTAGINENKEFKGNITINK